MVAGGPEPADGGRLNMIWYVHVFLLGDISLNTFSFQHSLRTFAGLREDGLRPRGTNHIQKGHHACVWEVSQTKL